MVNFFSHDFETILIPKTDQGQGISAHTTTTTFMSDKSVIGVDYIYYGILIFPNDSI